MIGRFFFRWLFFFSQYLRRSLVASKIAVECIHTVTQGKKGYHGFPNILNIFDYRIDIHSIPWQWNRFRVVSLYGKTRSSLLEKRGKSSRFSVGRNPAITSWGWWFIPLSTGFSYIPGGDGLISEPSTISSQVALFETAPQMTSKWTAGDWALARYIYIYLQCVVEIVNIYIYIIFAYPHACIYIYNIHVFISTV